MAGYAAFLRGVNVGGKATVKMTDLKQCFEVLGLCQVTTYINSGNVVFQSDEGDSRFLESLLEPALAARFGFAIAVAVRSLTELSALFQQVSPSWHTVGAEKRNVIFLRPTIDQPEILANFQPKPGIETVQYVPGALLWSAETSNLNKSAMLKVSGSPLYKEMTVRIFATVQKVYELMHMLD